MQDESNPIILTSAKPVTQSKTVGFNVGALVSALAFVTLSLTLPQVTAIIPPALMGAVLAVVAVINLYLRIYKTSQPIAL